MKTKFLLLASLICVSTFSASAQVLDVEGLVIPIVAITVPFTFVFLMVGIIVFTQYRSRAAKYKVLEKAIESGRDIPADIFNGPKKIYGSEKYLKDSLCVIGSGLGIIIFGFIIDNMPLIGAGCVPLFLGLGLLTYSLLAKKNDK